MRRMLFNYLHIVWTLFFCIIVSISQPPINVPRHYLAKRDLFDFFKAGEYSITDAEKKTLYYRIESRYHLTKRVEIIRYPEKTKTGQLKSKINGLTFEGEFSILNETTDQWITGEIEQNFRWFQTSFILRWNGHEITMENNGKNLTDQFRDENHDLLAESQIELGSILWRKKYIMRIFSNKYPEEIYLLALSASDRT